MCYWGFLVDGPLSYEVPIPSPTAQSPLDIKTTSAPAMACPACCLQGSHTEVSAAEPPDRAAFFLFSFTFSVGLVVKKKKKEKKKVVAKVADHDVYL